MVRLIGRVAFVAALVLGSQTAFANERTLSNQTIVFKNSTATSDALKLIESGAARRDPGLIAPFVACMAAAGSRFVVTSGGIMTSDIMITSGASRGCRGNVPSEMTR